MRKPKIENKYNIRPEDLNRAEVIDRDRITRTPFWRNDLIKAWCLSGTTAKNASENCIAGECRCSDSKSRKGNKRVQFIWWRMYIQIQRLL